MCSPYAGETLSTHLVQAERKAEDSKAFRLEYFAVGTLNPGRSGLTAIRTGEVLWWRLWDIASTMTELNIRILFLPGARWPPGAQLPPGYPYFWLGRQSVSWDSVGALVLAEVADAVFELEDFSTERIMWLAVFDEIAP